MVPARELLAPSDVDDEAVDGVHRAVGIVEVTALRRGPDRRQRLHQIVDGGAAVEILTSPGRGKVPPLHERPRRLAQRRAGTVVRGPSGTHLLPEDTPHARAGIGERRFEPPVEDAVEEATRDVLGRHLELRVHARLHRALAQQVGAEAVDRADGRGLELRQRRLQPVALDRGPFRVLPLSFDGRSQPQLQLACRRVREGDRNHMVEARRTARQPFQHATDQRGRLAGSGGRFDDEGRREIRADAVAGGLVGQRGASGHERP